MPIEDIEGMALKSGFEVGTEPPGTPGRF